MNDIAEIIIICKKYGFKNPFKVETDSSGRYYMIDTNDRQHKIYVFENSILKYIYVDKKICKAEDILIDANKNLEPVNIQEPVNIEPEKQEDNNTEQEDIKKPEDYIL